MEKNYKIQIIVSETDVPESETHQVSIQTYLDNINNLKGFGINVFDEMLSKSIEEIEKAKTPKLLSDDEINLTILKDMTEAYINSLSYGEGEDQHFENDILLELFKSLYGNKIVDWLNEKL